MDTNTITDLKNIEEDVEKIEEDIKKIEAELNVKYKEGEGM